MYPDISSPKPNVSYARRNRVSQCLFSSSYLPLYPSPPTLCHSDLSLQTLQHFGFRKGQYIYRLVCFSGKLYRTDISRHIWEHFKEDTYLAWSIPVRIVCQLSKSYSYIACCHPITQSSINTQSAIVNCIASSCNGKM